MREDMRHDQGAVSERRGVEAVSDIYAVRKWRRHR